MHATALQVSTSHLPPDAVSNGHTLTIASTKGDTMRRLPLTLALLLAAGAACSAASSAIFTNLKPIVLDPSYRHDRFDTQPKDIIRHFRAYTTRRPTPPTATIVLS